MNTVAQKNIQESSAGGVVFKIVNGPASANTASLSDATAGRQIFVLVIKPAKSKRSSDDPKWTFPKGHIGDHHEGESPEGSAIREVREEGGVVAQILEKISDISYSYVWGEENISKTVSYFLMKYVSGDTSDHDHEVEIAEWLSVEEANKRIFWPGDKQVLEKAKNLISKYA